MTPEPRRAADGKRSLPKLRLSATRELADGAQLAEMRFFTWAFRCDYRLHIAFFRAEFEESIKKNRGAQRQMRKPRCTERERTDDTFRLSATRGVSVTLERARKFNRKATDYKRSYVALDGGGEEGEVEFADIEKMKKQYKAHRCTLDQDYAFIQNS